MRTYRIDEKACKGDLLAMLCGAYWDAQHSAVGMYAPDVACIRYAANQVRCIFAVHKGQCVHDWFEAHVARLGGAW